MNLNQILEVSLLIGLLSVVPWFWLFTVLKFSIDYLDQLTSPREAGKMKRLKTDSWVGQPIPPTSLSLSLARKLWHSSD